MTCLLTCDAFAIATKLRLKQVNPHLDLQGIQQRRLEKPGRGFHAEAR